MFVNLKRTVIAFAAVLGVFIAYCLIAVPLIEPRIEEKRVQPLTAQQIEEIHANQLKNRLGGYMRFFPEGSWERDKPILLESETSKLLLKEYTNLPDGRVQITPCTVIYLPDGDAEQEGSHKRVIIMRAQQAFLQFDTPVDLGRGKLGKLLGGTLDGPIRIESAETRPGANDDLLITTHDVKMIENRIVTPNEVDFRFGPSYGHGRNLRIDLLPSADVSSKNRGPSIGGIQSFELTNDVQMHLQPGNSGFVPGDKSRADQTQQASQPAPSQPPSAKSTPLGAMMGKGPQPPVDIRCQGPFQFDLVSYIASFHDRVDVVRPSPIGGVSDQLNCELLSIFFAPKEAKLATTAKGNSKKAAAAPPPPTGGIPPLEPRRLEAVGSPVTVHAPSNQLDARGEQLNYDIVTGRIELKSNEEVLLNQATNEARAKTLIYEPGPDNSLLGYLDSDGPGFLRASTPSDPTRQFEAHWSRKLTMLPQDENHVVSLRGDAMASYAGSQLSGETIDVWLHQLSPDEIAARAQQARHGAKGPNSNSPLSGIIPVKMQADGGVHIESEQLSGVVRRMEAWFRDSGEPVAAPTQAKSDAPRSNRPRLERAPPAQARSSTPKAHYEIKRGGLLQAWVLFGQRPEPENVVLKDDVWFVQSPSETEGEKPLEVIGDEVRLLHANTPGSELAVTGRPAQVGGRGLTMFGQAVQMNRAANRVWIDGVGRMTFADDRPKPNPAADAAGNPTVEPAPPTNSAMTIDFQGGMNFDGSIARFERNVVGTRTEDRQEKQVNVHVSQIIRTPKALEITLHDRIDFAAQQQQRPGTRPQMELLSAEGHVYLENKQTDDGHLTSVDQFQVNDLKINQLSGELNGQGPGQLYSWRLGNAAAGAFRPGTPVTNVSAQRPPADASQINYLDVQFQRDLTGNVLSRVLNFNDQVRSIYGPVASWDARVDAESVNGLPPRCMLLTSDVLSVNEAGPRVAVGVGPVEMKATGNTRIEGQGEQTDTFFAQAHQLTYSQQKGMIELDGDGRTSAQLTRQERPGSEPQKVAGRQITYSPQTGRWAIGGFQNMEASQFSVPQQRAPKSQLPGSLDPSRK
jgi:lipopolysaccharide export system protein LptA